MENILQAIVISFREGLEAFLILVLILKFLEKTNNKHLRISVIYGFIISILFSILLGFFLFKINAIFQNVTTFGKLWESVASLIAVGLVFSFIIMMINTENQMKQYVENKISVNLSKFGVYIITFILIAREGMEVVLFSFAGKYPVVGVIIGLFVSLLISLGIYLSLLNVSVSLLFKITLFYLIIQAGYLLGYGFHEGLSALKDLHVLDANNILLIKIFDLTKTIFDHKEGIVGLPLNILLGWYSKPEWIQFLLQYFFSIFLLLYWFQKSKSKKIQ